MEKGNEGLENPMVKTAQRFVYLIDLEPPEKTEKEDEEFNEYMDMFKRIEDHLIDVVDNPDSFVVAYNDLLAGLSEKGASEDDIRKIKEVASLYVDEAITGRMKKNNVSTEELGSWAQILKDIPDDYRVAILRMHPRLETVYNRLNPPSQEK